MSTEVNYKGDFTSTDIIVNDVNIDEGCVPDLNEEVSYRVLLIN